MTMHRRNGKIIGARVVQSCKINTGIDHNVPLMTTRDGVLREIRIQELIEKYRPFVEELASRKKDGWIATQEFLEDL